MKLCEEIIDRYESDVADMGAAELLLANYLPQRDAPEYIGTLVELLRIRMEHQFGQSRVGLSLRGGLDDCVTEFPELRQHSDQLGWLAFEEYRLRQAAGESVSPREYSSRWQVDTSQWQDEESERTLSQSDWQAAMDRESRGPASQKQAAAESAGTASQNPKQPAVLACGHQFGPFRVLAEIGRGSLARVYLAQQLDLSERLVVLKVCTRATREPQKIAQLQHPNIVQILSLHAVGNYQVLCMPYAGATTLADIVKLNHNETSVTGTARGSREFVTTLNDRQRQIQTLIEHSWPTTVDAPLVSRFVVPANWQQWTFEQIVCEILLQVSRGLIHAHDRGIVHSDLKPANILLGDDGQARLVDFNVSQLSSAGQLTDHVGGTLPYMAPEHLESLRDNVWHAGPPSDLFSLGVIAYQLLSGKLPFRPSKSGLERMVKQMLLQQATAPPDLRQFHVSPDVCSIIEKLMQPSLQNRYATAAQVCEDLERHLQHLPLKHAANRSLTQRCQKWVKRHPRLSSAASIGTLATFVVVASIMAFVSASLQLRRAAAKNQLAQFQQMTPELFVAAISSKVFPELRPTLLEQVRQVRQQLETSTDSDPHVWRYLPSADRQSMAADLNSLASVINDTLLADPSVDWRSEAPARSEWQQAADSLRRLGEQVVAPEKLLPPSDVHVVSLQSAVSQYNSGQVEQAARTLRESLEGRTQQPAAWMLLGHCYAHQRQFALADQAYASGLAFLPQQWRGWYSRGLANLERARITQRREDYALAEECMTRALAWRPTLVVAHYNRALCREQLGKLNEAVADATQVAESGKLLVRVNLFMARLHGKLSQKEARARALQAAYAATPESAIDFAELGISRIAREPQLALADLEQAHRLDGTQLHVLQNLAYLTMEALPDPIKARQYLDAWVALAPASAVAVASRGVYLARQTEFEAATKDALQAELLSPTPREKAQIASIYALVMDSKDQEFGRQCRDKALQMLASALQLDWKLALEVNGDADLQRLAGDARFRQLLNVPLEMQKLPSVVQRPAKADAGKVKSNEKLGN